MLFNHDPNIKANKGRPRVWSPVGCPLVLLLLLTFTLCHSTSELQPIQLQDVRGLLELAQAKLVEVQQILGKLSELFAGGWASSLPAEDPELGQQPQPQQQAQQFGPDENRRHLGKWRRFASGPIKHPRANVGCWGSLGSGKLGKLAERVSQELLYNPCHKIKNRAQAGLKRGREAVTLVQDGARQAYGRIKRRTSRRRLKRGPRGGGDNANDDTHDDQDDDNDQEDNEGEIGKQKASGRVLLPFSGPTLPDMIGKVARVPPVAASSRLDQNNHHQNNHHPIQHHQHHDSRREDMQLSNEHQLPNGGHSFKRSRSYTTSMSSSSSISPPSPNVPPPV